MRRGKILTTIRWVSAFVNVTLHICTPARAVDLIAPRFHVASGGLDMLTIVPGLMSSGPERRHGPVQFEVVPSKHPSEDRHVRIPAS
jgi:hypothetical protein